MTNKIKKKILIVSNYIHFWQTAEFYEVLKHKFDCKIIIPKNSKFILDHIDVFGGVYKMKDLYYE